MRHLPVVEDTRCGLLTETDMLRQLVAHGLPQPRHTIRLTAECEEDELGTFGPYRPAHRRTYRTQAARLLDAHLARLIVSVR